MSAPPPASVLFIDNDNVAPSTLSVPMTDAAILDQELDHVLTLLSALTLGDDNDALVGDDDFGNVPLATFAATTATSEHNGVLLDVNATSVTDEDTDSLIFDPASGRNNIEVQAMNTTDIFPIRTSSLYQNGNPAAMHSLIRIPLLIRWFDPLL